MSRRVWPLVIAALALCCQTEPLPNVADGGRSAVQCDPHRGGLLGFTRKTDAWGLGNDGLKATGNRLVAADLDRDGYPDLLVHHYAPNQRTQVGTGPWYQRVLMNRPNPAGGRRFVDTTMESGLFQVRGGSTSELRSTQLAVAGDVDNDGDLDVFTGTYVDPTSPNTDTGDRSEIMLNDGSGKFSLAPPSSPTPGPNDRWPTSSAAFTDVDRDGRLDLFVGFWYASYGSSYLGVQAQLYRGSGDGQFRMLTEDLGLKTDTNFDTGTNHRPAYGVTACDLNGDLAPELMVSAYGRQSNLLYQNNGDGLFAEVSASSGFGGDDNRHFKDNQFFRCHCTVNRATDPDCEGIPDPVVKCPNPPDRYWSALDKQPWRSNGNTFSTWCGDLDQDGDNDLYSAEIVHWWAGQSSDSSQLLRNESTAQTIQLVRPGNETTGLVWPHPTPDWNEGGIMVAGGDLDLDGRMDLLVGASDYPQQNGLLFLQKPDGRFEEVAAAVGFTHPCVSGLTTADFDRDGDLDVIVGSGTARDCAAFWSVPEIHFYENTASETGKGLVVQLVGDGVTANRSAVGAKVTVQVVGKTFTREVGGGYGHFGQQNDLAVHFGLGACTAVDAISVTWPDKAGTTETWAYPPTGGLIELRQGDPKIHLVVPSL